MKDFYILKLKAIALSCIALITLNTVTFGQAGWELVHYDEGAGMIRDIDFVPGDDGLWLTGWAINFEGHILKTTNGGETWVEYPVPFSESLGGVDFVNEDVGYISTISDGKILKSVDGGITWSETFSNPDFGFDKPAFADEDNGTVCGYTQHYTTDGGTNWIETNVPDDHEYWDLDYASNNTYYAVYLGGDLGKSTDGGATWTNISHLGQMALGVDFYDENHGLFCGDLSKIKVTHDGGQSWIESTVGTGQEGVMAAGFYDPDTIYASGSPAHMYKSTDGGNTWDIETTFDGVNIRTIVVTETNVVYACGAVNATWSEVIYRRADNVEFLSADFEASETEFCQDNTIDFTDLSTGNVISWEWTFEGGTPATSTEQNPSVTYATPGTYDVELTVGDGITTQSSTKSDYINVLTIPGQADMPSGDESVCGDETSVYTSTGADYATSYDWNFSPGSAGSITANGLQATVVWNPEFAGNAFISLSGMNECGDGDVSEVLIVEVLGIPMPEVSGEDLVCEGQIEEYVVENNTGSTYTWNVTGGTITDGQGTSMITVSWGEPGDGAVEVTEAAATGCMGDSEAFEVMIDDCTGLFENNDGNGITLYPNPVRNILNIRLDDITGNDVQIKIFDVLGKLIINEKVNNRTTGSVHSIDMSSFAEGLYFMQIQTHGASLSQQFIKR